jgi:hypothetical protein
MMNIENAARGVLLVVFIAIFASCAAILLGGQVLAVFYGYPLPSFYNYAFGLVILEPIGFLLLWMKNAFGLRNTIKTVKCSSDAQINNYMKTLISMRQHFRHSFRKVSLG